MAASNGIKAVKLAKAGLIASPVALEGKCGYAKLFSEKSITENAIRFGDSWKLLLQDLLIKKYPCCSASHAALNGMEELMEENRLHYHDVKRVVVGVPKFTLINLIHPEPKNPTEARFSMHYALASVLVTGRFDVNSFHSKALNNEEVRSVMKRIEMKEGEDFKETPYIDNEPAVIDLYTYDGHYYHKRIDFAKGTTVNPFTEDELAEKFFACLGGETEKNKKVLENLRNIENIPDVRFFLGMAL